MMIAQAPTTALHRLPDPEQPPREFKPTVDGISTVLDWLANEGVNGALIAQAGSHELAMLILGGVLVGASLRSPDGRPLLGAAALRGLIERASPDAPAQTKLLTYSRPLTECLCAALDPQPSSRPLTNPNQLRDALLDLAALAHHGVVDLTNGERWGRTLFHHGRMLGAYHYDDRHIAPSLAALGRLAAGGGATLTILAVPKDSLTRLRWPAIVGDAQHTADGQGRSDPRDERIETNLLWLLSHVERDRDRAGSGNHKREQSQLQVLASFANAMFSFAAHLAPGSPRGVSAVRLAAAIELLRPEYPLVEELELRDDELDAPALAKRYRAIPRHGEFAAEFYRGMTCTLLALTAHAAQFVVDEISQPAAQRRCAAAIETWRKSVEASLDGPAEAGAGDE